MHERTLTMSVVDFLKEDKNAWDLTICCMGAGYVGGPTMAMIASKCPKIRVIVVDLSQKQIDAWNSKELPIYEPGLDEVVQGARGKNLFFSTDINAAIEIAEIIFVSVNTPTKVSGFGAGTAADIKNCEACARTIAKVAKTSKIVVEKSTVPVQTAEAMEAVLDANSEANPDVKFHMLSNPEFLAEGTAIQDLSAPDRVLIGGRDNTEGGRKAIETLVSVYANWVPREQILTTNLWSSELSKLVANAMLAQRISSINTISALCEKSGANVREVARACGMDDRIGSKFLNASVGFGGSCFQKDILNLVYLCENFGLHEAAAYWRSVVEVNDYQKDRFTRLMVRSMHRTVTNKKIAMFGFAFKKDTGDVRETAAGHVILKLVNEGAKLSVWDPKVHNEEIWKELEHQSMSMKVSERQAQFNGHHAQDMMARVKERTIQVHDPYNAAKDAHAICVITEWDEFKTYDFQKIYDSMLKPAFIFDGRNILDHAKLREIGFKVYALGEPMRTKDGNSHVVY